MFGSNGETTTMAGDVTRDEFDHLRTRVDVVEREVDGEKLVTRHILEQTRRNGDDLATLKGDMKGLRSDMADLRSDMTNLRSDMTGLRGTVHGLAANLPRIVGEAVRNALRERKAK
jgi:hypothetical protein